VDSKYSGYFSHNIQLQFFTTALTYVTYGSRKSWNTKKDASNWENPKIHYRGHENLPLVPTLSQMHPIHNFPVYFLNINSNIIFLSMPRSSKLYISFRFSDKNFVCIYRLSYVCYTSNILHLHLTTLVIFVESYKWHTSLRISLHPGDNFCLLAPNILLSSTFSNTVSLRYSLKQRRIHRRSSSDTTEFQFEAQRRVSVRSATVYEMTHYN
jgi:hypothetical protein